MSQQIQVITDFTKGELSPRMMGRFDLQDYYRGAQEILNFIPFFPGGVTYRPGTIDVGPAKTGSGLGRVRLRAFVVSPSVKYILEFGPLYLRFWRNDAIVGGGSPTEVTTPWGAGDLEGLQFAQAEASLYIVSGTAPIKILTMTATDTFTFGDLTITGNTGQVPFGSTGNYPRCIAIHDGRLYAACTDNDPDTIWSSKPFDFGNFTYWDTISNTSRQLREPVNLFTADTTNASTTVSGIDAAEIANFKVGDRITGPGIIGKNKVTFVGKTTLLSTTIENVSTLVMAQLEVGETVTGTTIPASTIMSKGTNTIVIDNAATASNNVATLERDERRTYIQSIGTTSIVLTTAATADGTDVELTEGWADPTIPEYENVTTTRDIVTSASAFKKQIASDQNERILWLASGRDLVVGTTSGERIIPSGANSYNFTCRRQTAIGSAPVQPFFLNEAILFIESNGRGCREYLYSMQEEAYQSPSLTATADHILAGEVRESDYSNTPVPIAWFVLEDGTVAGCSYSRLYGLAAWFKVTHATGTIESVAVIPGTTQDDTYFAVNVGGVRRIEKLGALFGTTGHLDSCVTKTKTTGGITGVDWITGAATAVYNGTAYAITIAGGASTLPVAIPDGATVLIGRGYTGRIHTMPTNAQSRLGTAHLRPKTVSRLLAKLLASYPFQVGFEDGTLETASFTGPATGDYEVPVLGTWDSQAALKIVQANPFDVTILAIMPEIDAGG